MHGAFSVQAWGGYGKFDVLDTFIEFNTKSDNLPGKHIKPPQLEWGAMSCKFDFSVGAWSDLSLGRLKSLKLSKGTL